MAKDPNDKSIFGQYERVWFYNITTKEMLKDFASFAKGLEKINSELYREKSKPSLN